MLWVESEYCGWRVSAVGGVCLQENESGKFLNILVFPRSLRIIQALQLRLA